jgi:hypothetical protein
MPELHSNTPQFIYDYITAIDYDIRTEVIIGVSLYIIPGNANCKVIADDRINI